MSCTTACLTNRYFEVTNMKKIGKQVLFLSTSETNPRNGEGSFIRLKDGSILYGYTEYIGTSWNDHAEARITGVISRDEGETWGEKHVILERPVNSKNVMSLSFLRMGNGDIGAFYIFKNPDGTDNIWMIRSADEAQTWGEPINCMGKYKDSDYYVLNNDRVLRLQSGRILYAVGLHSGYRGQACFAPGVMCFFYSDDDGFTWQKTEQDIPMPFATDSVGFQEPGLYEFEDGRIWCYSRTNLGCQCQCFSEDQGQTWKDLGPNYFFSSPTSPMLVKRTGPYTVAVFNPEPNYNGRPKEEPWGRTPYVCAVSTDDGKTFTKDRMYYIEDDRRNGYCYPAIIEGDGYFLVAYYHSNNTGVCLNSCKIVKVLHSELA